MLRLAGYRCLLQTCQLVSASALVQHFWTKPLVGGQVPVILNLKLLPALFCMFLDKLINLSITLVYSANPCSVQAFYKLTSNAKAMIKNKWKNELRRVFFPGNTQMLKCEISIEICHSFCTFLCWQLHVWGSSCTHAACTGVGSPAAAVVEFTWEAHGISEDGRRWKVVLPL